ncbi:hypothetical protein BOTNAR_0705g00010 [Botryotinia narcissicola]|uniref:Uncharacterized protein n=1 Tax=Botryotinia narcissicola TaxID=278944 RepID=A0A4Z1HJ30_9HELO|nr:hypothetical protein BOTNAR_0705g00010 [Botryotinia narcissicola]
MSTRSRFKGSSASSLYHAVTGPNQIFGFVSILFYAENGIESLNNGMKLPFLSGSEGNIIFEELGAFNPQLSKNLKSGKNL